MHGLIPEGQCREGVGSVRKGKQLPGTNGRGWCLSSFFPGPLIVSSGNPAQGYMGPAVGFVANVGWSAAQLGGRAAWYGGELACKAAYYGGTAAWNGSKAAWNGGTSVWAGIRKEVCNCKLTL
eukprot:1161019-Pelagomonas_calceolata.AAC.3